MLNIAGGIVIAYLFLTIGVPAVIQLIVLIAQAIVCLFAALGFIAFLPVAALATVYGVCEKRLVTRLSFWVSMYFGFVFVFCHFYMRAKGL